jgi:hypothetical protein
MGQHIKLSLYLVNQAAHPYFRQSRLARKPFAMKHIGTGKKGVARHLPSDYFCARLAYSGIDLFLCRSICSN